MSDEIIAMMLSLVGMVLTMISFQAEKKLWYVILQSTGSTFYLVSYIFSGGGIAIYLNIIFLIRNFISLPLDKASVKARRWACGIICAACAMVYILFISLTPLETSEKIWSITPVIGAFFGAFATLSKDMMRLRLLKYGDSLGWISYNTYIGIGALGGIIGEIFNITSTTIAILRFRKKKEVESDGK